MFFVFLLSIKHDVIIKKHACTLKVRKVYEVWDPQFHFIHFLQTFVIINVAILLEIIPILYRQRCAFVLYYHYYYICTLESSDGLLVGDSLCGAHPCLQSSHSYHPQSNFSSLLYSPQGLITTNNFLMIFYIFFFFFLLHERNYILLYS